MAKRTKKGDRIAIIAGLRTPFAKMGTAYKNMSTLDLGKLCVSELMQRTGIDAEEIDQVVYGQVAPSLVAPNIAREIVLGLGMPRDIEAYSVSRACATSYQSTASVAESIMAGSIDVGIAGGADSASDVTIGISKKLRNALVAANSARTLQARLKAFSKLSPKDLLPAPPALREPSTGLTMGEHAEVMAKDWGISREEQDALAHASHTNAAKAWADGRLKEEVMEVFVGPKYKTSIGEDNIVRKDSKLEAYKKLRPAFDRKHGTLTAANSSPLTDGASAILMMRASKAKQLGLNPIGFLTSFAFTGNDPNGHMLMGPSYSTPKALDRAGMQLSDVDLIDMHEAFAAQVLCNVRAFESKEFAKNKLGRSKATGKIDMSKLNVTGGSISIGHPFAATGTRQITQTLNELNRRGGGVGLCTACAAGGLGAAMILETE